MPTKIDTPQLDTEGYRSHWVELNGRGNISKIEVFPRFTTSWRGQEVTVTMSCDRYRYAGMTHDSDGDLTAWRCYASEVRPAVTETARSRLSDACKPVVTAWLESTEYAESERRALVHALARELRDSTKHYDDSTRARSRIERYRNDIGADATTKLLTACDALDAYTRATKAIGNG